MVVLNANRSFGTFFLYEGFHYIHMCLALYITVCLSRFVPRFLLRRVFALVHS